MIFAILFVVAFLFGLASYALTQRWVISISVPIVLFLIAVLWGESEKGALAFTLTFGLPLVCFAGLFGAYVYQIKKFPPDEVEEENQINDEQS